METLADGNALETDLVVHDHVVGIDMELGPGALIESESDSVSHHRVVGDQRSVAGR